MTTSKETQKPETYVLRIDIEQRTFELDQDTFESALNLQLAIANKEFREYLINAYLKKHGKLVSDTIEP